MQAAYLTGHGGNEVVAVGERPRPQRRPGDVLGRLRAATVNRVDLYRRDSGVGITHALPLIMGLDGAGVVGGLAAFGGGTVRDLVLDRRPLSGSSRS